MVFVVDGFWCLMDASFCLFGGLHLAVGYAAVLIEGFVKKANVICFLLCGFVVVCHLTGVCEYAENVSMLLCCRGRKCFLSQKCDNVEKIVASILNDMHKMNGYEKRMYIRCVFIDVLGFVLMAHVFILLLCAEPNWRHAVEEEVKVVT